MRGEPGIGTEFGNYRLAELLSRGGMGVVYLAEDVHTGVPIVLKAVRPELAHRKDIRDRTLTEGRTLARIDHPNVVHLNAIVEDATGLWLVMQYIDGESLDHTIKRYTKEGGTIAFTVAIDIFRQILNGVGAAHHEGVVHRDLKPANVLVRRKDGVVKVTDFGIAKPSEEMRAGAGAGKTKGVIGSLWYMAPEQVQGRRDLDMRADIYALGILLFELLTGHVPFNAESSYEIMRMHVEVPLPSVVAERSDAPAWIDEVLGRACAKAREARFSSCEEFLAAIEQHAGPQPRKTQVAAAGLTPGVHDGPHAAVPATMAGTATTGPIAGAGTRSSARSRSSSSAAAGSRCGSSRNLPITRSDAAAQARAPRPTNRSPRRRARRRRRLRSSLRRSTRWTRSRAAGRAKQAQSSTR